MIYIKETLSDNNLVKISVDGFLDNESIPVLKAVCERYLNEEKRVQVHLGGLIHASREGRNFLKEMEKKVFFVK